MPLSRISALFRKANSEQTEFSLPILKTAIWRGAKGGFIATAIMTIYRLPVFRALPPTADFWARYLGGEAEQYTLSGILLHFLYGTVAGAVFGVLFTRITLQPVRSREWVGIVSGALYGVVLSLFGTRVLFRHVLGRELESDHALVFHVGHLMYGLTLGTWMGTRERVGDVYEEAQST